MAGVSLADIFAGRAQWPTLPGQQPATDTTSNVVSAEQPNVAEAGVPSVTRPPVRRVKSVAMSDIFAGRATPNDDGTFTINTTPDPAQAPDGDSDPWQIAYDTFLSTGTGATSGVEMIGALTELIPGLTDLGEQVRQSGRSMTQYLMEKMSPEQQQAFNKSWLDLSKNGAIRDWRAWVGGVAQQVPYILGTAGVGEVAALGVRGAGSLAARATGKKVAEQTVEKTALRKAKERTAGYVVASSAAGAGEAAAGAGAAVDEAGGTPEQRLTAMRVAGAGGAAAGALVGPGLEKMIHGPARAAFGLKGRAKDIAKRAATGIVTEGIEEGGTAAAAEGGKAAVGLPVDYKSIAEQAVAGAALGGPLGVGLSAPAARRMRKIAAQREDQRLAEEQAVIAERDRVAADEAMRAEEQATRRPVVTPTPQPTGAPGTTPPLYGPSPAQPSPLSLPVPILPGPQPVGEGTVIPMEGELGLSQYGEEEAELGGPKSDRRLRTLSKRADRAGAVLDTAREAARTSTGAARLKAVNKFRRARETFAKATRARDQYQDRLNRQSDKMTMQPLPGFDRMDEPAPNPSTIEMLDDAELKRDLDEAFGPEDGQTSETETEPPLLKKMREAAQRSQRARAAALTRWQKKRSAQSGVTQTPVEISAPGVPRPSGSPEAAAVRARGTKSAPASGVSVIGAVPAPQASVPGGQGATAPSAQPPPTSLPGGQQTEPVLPPAPQPQPGGVMSAPTSPDLVEQPAVDVPDTTSGVIPPEAPVAVPTPPPLKSKPRRKKLSAMTPRERLSHMLREGPRGVDVVLAGLQDAFNNSSDTRVFKLIQKLRKAFPNSAKNPLQTKVVMRPLSNGFQALYDPKSDTIYIDPNQAEDMVGVMLHEAIHAATLSKLRTNVALRKQLEGIMENAADGWTKLGFEPAIDTVQGFGSVEEFITAALTDTAFADRLAALPQINTTHGFIENDRSVWSRLKKRLSVMFDTPSETSSDHLFHALLELIPDGTFLQEGNRQEVLTQLDNLGLSQPVASLLSSYRSMLRLARTNPGGLGRRAAGGSGRVWGRLLPLMAVNQIAESYGDTGKFWIDPASGLPMQLNHDTINQYAKLLEQRDGHIASLRETASRIIGVGKEAMQQLDDTKLLDDLLINSRLWGLHADRGMHDPANRTGILKPGGALSWSTLNQAWVRLGQLSPKGQDFYKLVTFNSTAQRTRDMQQIMSWRVRQLVSLQAAKQFDAMVASLPIINNGAPAGVEISYHRMPTALEVKTFVRGLPRLTGVQQRRLYQSVMQVTRAFGREEGPYVPLRRTGKYYVMLKGFDQTLRSMTPAQFNALVHSNRVNNQGDMEILEENYDIATNTYTPKVRHIVVGSANSETEAAEMLADFKADWSSRGIRIESERDALRANKFYAMKGLHAASVEAMRNSVRDDVSKAMGTVTGDKIAEMITKYYLDKLPEGSVRKSQMKARKIAGATRDMLMVYANYADGSAYFSGQMMYGADIANTIGQKMDEDIKILHNARQTGQANDLQILQDYLRERDDKYERVSAQNVTADEDWLRRNWQRIPQVTSAWMLTGLGTTLTNATQPWVFGLPHLGARHGMMKSAMALRKAMMQLVVPIGGETLREYGRGLKGLPKAAAVGAGVRKYTSEIRDPSQPMFAKAVAALPANERQHIEALALRRKIDFGLTADIQSISKRASGRWMATQYMMDMAFILPQAAETMNRISMGLASYRLNEASVRSEVQAANPGLSQGQQYELIQQRLLDIAATDIDRTQWNYNASNRPGAFQNEWLRFALVFKTFPQNVLYSVMHNTIQAMHARTPQERKIARKYIAGMLAMTWIGAGAIGMITLDPFYIVALALTAGLTDEDDPEKALREAMQDWLGEDWMPMINSILKGPIYGSGALDTSRLALPSIVPWDDVTKLMSGTAERGTNYYTVFGEAMLGAPGSLVQQGWTAALMYGRGNYGGAVEQLTPKAFGINDAVRAWNYANRGLADTRGQTYLDPKEIGWADVIRRGLGFDPPEISSFKQARRTFFADLDRVRARKSELIDEFKQTLVDRDREGRREVLQQIIAFNKANPGERITRSGLKSSLRTTAKNEYLIGEYGASVRNPGQLKRLREIQELYGVER